MSEKETLRLKERLRECEEFIDLVAGQNIVSINIFQEKIMN